MTFDVLEAVSDHDGRDVTALPPLSDVVNPDALEALFSAPGVEGSPVRSLTFLYAGYTVGIDAEGNVTVEEDHLAR